MSVPFASAFLRLFTHLAVYFMIIMSDHQTVYIRCLFSMHQQDGLMAHDKQINSEGGFKGTQPARAAA